MVRGAVWVAWLACGLWQIPIASASSPECGSWFEQKYEESVRCIVGAAVPLRRGGVQASAPGAPRRIPPRLPTPNPKPSATPWIIAGVGGVMMLGGALMIGLAFVAHDERLRLEGEFQKRFERGADVPATDTRRLRDAYVSSVTLLSLGAGVSGVGLVVAVTGVLIGLTYKPRPKGARR